MHREMVRVEQTQTSTARRAEEDRCQGNHRGWPAACSERGTQGKTSSEPKHGLNSAIWLRTSNHWDRDGSLKSPTTDTVKFLGTKHSHKKTNPKTGPQANKTMGIRSTTNECDINSRTLGRPVGTSCHRDAAVMDCSTKSHKGDTRR